MTMFHKVTQVTPLLRRGIISSVFPFAGRFPHGFTADIMIQGGASGSPVFLEDQPTVVGMLGASLLDENHNTNISIALPGHLLADALKALLAADLINFSDVPALKSMIPADQEAHRSVTWKTLP